MKVVYRLNLGQDSFELHADVKDEKDFFEQMSFYSNLPKTAPNGATDLKLVFRTTKEGHKYYSLVSEKEKMEFKFGQSKENNGGGLFPKGWEKLYEGEQSQASSGPVQMPGIQQPQVQTQVQAPVTAPPIQMPTTVAAPPMPTQMTAPPPVAPTPAATPAAAPAAANPQVQNVANNVLARFGIQKQ